MFLQHQHKSEAIHDCNFYHDVTAFANFYSNILNTILVSKNTQVHFFLFNEFFYRIFCVQQLSLAYNFINLRRHCILYKSWLRKCHICVKEATTF